MVGSRRWPLGTRSRASDPPVDDDAEAADGPLTVTVLPGFNSQRPNVWIRSTGATEVTDLLVTHELATGAAVAVDTPSSRLLPGEACVLTLGEPGGSVLVAARGMGDASAPEITIAAAVPVPRVDRHD